MKDAKIWAADNATVAAQQVTDGHDDDDDEGCDVEIDVHVGDDENDSKYILENDFVVSRLQFINMRCCRVNRGQPHRWGSEYFKVF